MAVIHAQGTRTDAQSFTSNKALLRASIKRLTPDVGAGVFDEETPGCILPMLRNTYETIEAISERLGAVTGRRKAILWVNGRVPFDPVDECRRNDEIDAGMSSSVAFMYRDAMRAAMRNNVAIYPIDPVGLTADPEPGRWKLARENAMRVIAEDTGGEAVINTNNFSAGFERIVRSHSAYYLLSYQPAVQHRDGPFHSISVRVRRAGLNVHARKGYLAPEPDAPRESGFPSDVSAAAAALLSKALPDNNVGLELFLAPFKGVDGNGSVILGAELKGLRMDGTPLSQVEISFVALDTDGRTRVAPPKMLALPPSSPSNGAAGYIERLTLPPGRHEVRMAVTQQNGVSGSVVAHVEVPDYRREPLLISGLLLASSRNDMPMLQADARLRALLSVDPTTRRRFRQNETLTAFVEAYIDARTKVDDISVETTIATARGVTVSTYPGERIVHEPGRVGYTMRVPLAKLSPGQYVVAMEARAGRRKATRQVLFQVE
jgi:hypothetical protein